MLRIRNLCAGVSVFALLAAPAIVNAAPVGTTAGTDIQNTVSVNYTVGGVAQGQVQAQDIFRVDRKINVTVSTTDSAAVAVTPGQTAVATTFTVTNNSNSTQDFLLTASDQSGGSANFSGTDTFDTTNRRVYIESNGIAGFQTTDTLSSTIAGLQSGDAAIVYIVADMIVTPGTPPVLPADNGTATVMLTATAASGATAGSAISGKTYTAGSGGTAVVQSTSNGKLTEETVFADAAYLTFDAQYNGKHSARSDYKVTAARLTVTKVSSVIADGVNTSAPYYAIPGATVQYCILVTNAAGGSTASNVSVSDPVPTALLQSGAINIRGPVASSADACAASNTGTGSISGTTVSGTLPDITAGQAAALVFQATIK